MSPGKSVVAALAIAAVVGAAGPVQAQSSFIGLYIDEGRTAWCATGPSGYQVEMWVWALIEEPSGVKSYGYDISLPPNVSATNCYDNPEIIPVYCDPKLGCPPGESGVFQTCQKGWTWLKKCTLVVNTTDPVAVQLVGHPASGVIALRGCDETVFTPIVVSPDIYLNYDLMQPPCANPVPSDYATWGAVKVLYE